MSFQKRVTYRNKKILESAEGEACVICGNTETTVFAHFNQSFAGKGIAQKADDCAGMFLCIQHHIQYDRPDPGQERLSDFHVLRGYYLTIRRLLDKGVLK